MCVAEYSTEKENRGQKNKRKVVHSFLMQKKKKEGNYVLTVEQGLSWVRWKR